MSGIQKQQQSKQTQVKSNTKKASEQATQAVNFEQLTEAPETMRSEQILAAQKQVGNQVVQRALDGKKKRDAATDDQGYLKGEINDAIQKKRGGGSPLPESLRDDAGKRLGHDFDDVRIHTDEQANELSQSINARAFTIGKDIFFKKGVFSPGSRAGRETLMHELTHVVQQSGGSRGNGRLKLGGTDTAYEKQADKVGKANSSVDSVKSASNSKGTVQRLQGRLDALRVKKNTKTEEEEKLQRQPDLVVQREEMPEEELMMQEEEELQMQPDVVGVVQRDKTVKKDEEDQNKKKDTLRVSVKDRVNDIEQNLKKDDDTAPKQRPQLKRQNAKVFSESELKKTQTDQQSPKQRPQLKRQNAKVFSESELKKTQTDQQSSKQRPQLKRQNAKVFSQSELAQVQDKHPSKNDSAPKNQMSPEDAHKEMVKQANKNDKKMSPEEAHKEMVKRANKNDKKMSPEDAHKEMVKRANKNDKKMSSEPEQKSSKWSSFKSGAKKTGGFLGGLGKRFLGKAVDDMSEQLFGKKEEKEEPAKETPSPVTVNLGGGDGGGGGGGFAMLEKYITENQKLKNKLKENNIPVD